MKKKPEKKTSGKNSHKQKTKSQIKNKTVIEVVLYQNFNLALTRLACSMS